MPTINRSMQRRSGVVDVLRGLSIAFVLLNHVNMRLFLAKLSYWQELPEAVHDALVWNGQNGVQIFFALSGYLITSTSLRRWGSLSSIRVREFYALRFARIVPLLLLLLAVLSFLHLCGTPGFVVGEETGGLTRALIAAVTLLFVLVILVSALLGGMVERYYSEPANRLLRRRFDGGGAARY